MKGIENFLKITSLSFKLNLQKDMEDYTRISYTNIGEHDSSYYTKKDNDESVLGKINFHTDLFSPRTSFLCDSATYHNNKLNNIKNKNEENTEKRKQALSLFNINKDNLNVKSNFVIRNNKNICDMDLINSRDNISKMNGIQKFRKSTKNHSDERCMQREKVAHREDVTTTAHTVQKAYSAQRPRYIHKCSISTASETICITTAKVNGTVVDATNSNIIIYPRNTTTRSSPKLKSQRYTKLGNQNVQTNGEKQNKRTDTPINFTPFLDNTKNLYRINLNGTIKMKEKKTTLNLTKMEEDKKKQNDLCININPVYVNHSSIINMKNNLPFSVNHLSNPNYFNTSNATHISNSSDYVRRSYNQRKKKNREDIPTHKNTYNYNNILKNRNELIIELNKEKEYFNISRYLNKYMYTKTNVQQRRKIGQEEPKYKSPPLPEKGGISLADEKLQTNSDDTFPYLTTNWKEKKNYPQTLEKFNNHRKNSSMDHIDMHYRNYNFRHSFRSNSSSNIIINNGSLTNGYLKKKMEKKNSKLKMYENLANFEKYLKGKNYAEILSKGKKQQMAHLYLRKSYWKKSAALPLSNNRNVRKNDQEKLPRNIYGESEKTNFAYLSTRTTLGTLSGRQDTVKNGPHVVHIPINFKLKKKLKNYKNGITCISREDKQTYMNSHLNNNCTKHSNMEEFKNYSGSHANKLELYDEKDFLSSFLKKDNSDEKSMHIENLFNFNNEFKSNREEVIDNYTCQNQRQEVKKNLYQNSSNTYNPIFNKTQYQHKSNDGNNTKNERYNAFDICTQMKQPRKEVNDSQKIDQSMITIKSKSERYQNKSGQNNVLINNRMCTSSKNENSHKHDKKYDSNEKHDYHTKIETNFIINSVQFHNVDEKKEKNVKSENSNETLFEVKKKVKKYSLSNQENIKNEDETKIEPYYLSSNWEHFKDIFLSNLNGEITLNNVEKRDNVNMFSSDKLNNVPKNSIVHNVNDENSFAIKGEHGSEQHINTKVGREKNEKCFEIQPNNDHTEKEIEEKEKEKIAIAIDERYKNHCKCNVENDIDSYDRKNKHVKENIKMKVITNELENIIHHINMINEESETSTTNCKKKNDSNNTEITKSMKQKNETEKLKFEKFSTFFDSDTREKDEQIMHEDKGKNTNNKSEYKYHNDEVTELYFELGMEKGGSSYHKGEYQNVVCSKDIEINPNGSDEKEKKIQIDNANMEIYASTEHVQYKQTAYTCAQDGNTNNGWISSQMGENTKGNNTPKNKEKEEETVSQCVSLSTANNGESSSLATANICESSSLATANTGESSYLATANIAEKSSLATENTCERSSLVTANILGGGNCKQLDKHLDNNNGMESKHANKIEEKKHFCSGESIFYESDRNERYASTTSETSAKSSPKKNNMKGKNIIEDKNFHKHHRNMENFSSSNLSYEEKTAPINMNVKKDYMQPIKSAHSNEHLEGDFENANLRRNDDIRAEKKHSVVCFHSSGNQQKCNENSLLTQMDTLSDNIIVKETNYSCVKINKDNLFKRLNITDNRLRYINLLYASFDYCYLSSKVEKQNKNYHDPYSNDIHVKYAPKDDTYKRRFEEKIMHIFYPTLEENHDTVSACVQRDISYPKNAIIINTLDTDTTQNTCDLVSENINRNTSKISEMIKYGNSSILDENLQGELVHNPYLKESHNEGALLAEEKRDTHKKWVVIGDGNSNGDGDCDGDCDGDDDGNGDGEDGNGDGEDGNGNGEDGNGDGDGNGNGEDGNGDGDGNDDGGDGSGDDDSLDSDGEENICYEDIKRNVWLQRADRKDVVRHIQFESVKCILLFCFLYRIKYFQGMHDMIISLFYLNLHPYEVFCVFEKILHYYAPYLYLQNREHKNTVSPKTESAGFITNKYPTPDLSMQICNYNGKLFRLLFQFFFPHISHYFDTTINDSWSYFFFVNLNFSKYNNVYCLLYMWMKLIEIKDSGNNVSCDFILFLLSFVIYKLKIVKRKLYEKGHLQNVSSVTNVSSVESAKSDGKNVKVENCADNPLQHKHEHSKCNKVGEVVGQEEESTEKHKVEEILAKHVQDGGEIQRDFSRKRKLSAYCEDMFSLFFEFNSSFDKHLGDNYEQHIDEIVKIINNIKDMIPRSIINFVTSYNSAYQRKEQPVNSEGEKVVNQLLRHVAEQEPHNEARQPLHLADNFSENLDNICLYVRVSDLVRMHEIGNFYEFIFIRLLKEKIVLSKLKSISSGSLVIQNFSHFRNVDEFLNYKKKRKYAYNNHIKTLFIIIQHINKKIIHLKSNDVNPSTHSECMYKETASCSDKNTAKKKNINNIFFKRNNKENNIYCERLRNDMPQETPLHHFVTALVKNNVKRLTILQDNSSVIKIENEKKKDIEEDINDNSSLKENSFFLQMFKKMKNKIYENITKDNEQDKLNSVKMNSSQRNNFMFVLKDSNFKMFSDRRTKKYITHKNKKVFFYSKNNLKKKKNEKSKRKSSIKLEKTLVVHKQPNEVKSGEQDGLHFRVEKRLGIRTHFLSTRYREMNTIRMFQGIEENMDKRNSSFNIYQKWDINVIHNDKLSIKSHIMFKKGKKQKLGSNTNTLNIMYYHLKKKKKRTKTKEKAKEKHS
ncbi:conserved Plasmodium protein, unknown function [Plasmodium ovale curtisi]|uniref:Uncharacterized protein n=1 Tax=Plasmodium ovale curtisi TaxID=864141 RepID=A0A1A8WKA7_PLAOA|nr:conserved Plasmodium protein, unknown function [Plasmodium ovale curtisi]